MNSIGYPNMTRYTGLPIKGASKPTIPFWVVGTLMLVGAVATLTLLAHYP